LKTITGEEEAAATVSSDGGGSGGAPADRVGAPGGAEDVNLWQDKLRERRMQHRRGRKGEKDEPFTGGELFQRRRRQGRQHWVDLVLERGRESVRGRKGGNEEDTRVLYGQREREGKAEGAVAGGLAIDGRRALRVMEE
jgi:hypothetical protein